MWIVEDNATLDYWISTDALSMLEETNINSLHSEPEKYEDIFTGKFMEPKNEIFKY